MEWAQQTVSPAVKAHGAARVIADTERVLAALNSP
jgi:hypothetical protein